MMDQRIIEGNSLFELPRLKEDSADLIIADPPYNLGKDYGNNRDNRDFEEYLTFTRSWTREAHRILKPNGMLYVFMGFRFIAHVFDILDRNLNMFFNSWIVWHYTQGM